VFPHFPKKRISTGWAFILGVGHSFWVSGFLEGIGQYGQVIKSIEDGPAFGGGMRHIVV
jgi:hypothetical protein